MRQKIGVSVALVLLMFTVGCAALRYNVTPQSNKGPHGGALVFVDRRMPEYVEFVASPVKDEWLFQVFLYDDRMRQKTFYGYIYMNIEFPDRTHKGIELWNTKPYAWDRKDGYYENKMRIQDLKEFVVTLNMRRGRSTERVKFNYPY
jgi:hypothetical protein